MNDEIFACACLKCVLLCCCVFCSLLFCFDRCQSLLNWDAIQEILAIQPKQLIQQWLIDIQQHHQSQHSNTDCQLPDHIVPFIYNRLFRLQRALLHAHAVATPLTHLQLFELMDEQLYSVYKRFVYDQHPSSASAIKRFQSLPQTFTNLSDTYLHQHRYEDQKNIIQPIRYVSLEQAVQQLNSLDRLNDNFSQLLLRIKHSRSILEPTAFPLSVYQEFLNQLDWLRHSSLVLQPADSTILSFQLWSSQLNASNLNIDKMLASHDIDDDDNSNLAVIRSELVDWNIDIVNTIIRNTPINTFKAHLKNTDIDIKGKTTYMINIRAES